MPTRIFRLAAALVIRGTSLHMVLGSGAGSRPAGASADCCLRHGPVEPGVLLVPRLMWPSLSVDLETSRHAASIMVSLEASARNLARNLSWGHGGCFNSQQQDLVHAARHAPGKNMLRAALSRRAQWVALVVRALFPGLRSVGIRRDILLRNVPPPSHLGAGGVIVSAPDGFWCAARAADCAANGRQGRSSSEFASRAWAALPYHGG